MAKRKAVFLDIDGTLTLPGRNEPPESARRAVALARERGNQVFLCTGRSMSMTEPLLPYGFDGAIASAGGIVRAGDRELFNCPIRAEVLERLMDVLEKHGIYRVLEGRSVVFGDRTLKVSLPDRADNSEMERWIQAMSDSLGVLPMEEYDGTPIYKIVFFYQREEQLQTPRLLFEKDFEFCLQTVGQSAGWLNGELINRSFNKGTAVRLLCEALDIPLEDTIGFGDSMNDLAMIESVGTSVCMGNGQQALKERCDYVCPGIEEDGLEKAFRELGLI